MTTMERKRAQSTSWLGSHSMEKRRLFQCEKQILDPKTRYESETKEIANGNLSGKITFDMMETDQLQIRNVIGLDSIIDPKKADKVALTIFGVGLSVAIFTMMACSLLWCTAWELFGMTQDNYMFFVYGPGLGLILCSFLYMLTNMNVRLLSKTIKEPWFYITMFPFIGGVVIAEWAPCYFTNTERGICKIKSTFFGGWVTFFGQHLFILLGLIFLANLDAFPSENKANLIVLSLMSGMMTCGALSTVTPPSRGDSSKERRRALKLDEDEYKLKGQGAKLLFKNEQGQSASRKLNFQEQDEADTECKDSLVLLMDYEKCPTKEDRKTKYCGNDLCRDICPLLWDDQKSDECFMCECKKQDFCNYTHYYRVAGEMRPLQIKEMSYAIMTLVLIRSLLLTIYMKYKDTKYTYTIRMWMTNMLVENVPKKIDNIFNSESEDVYNTNKNDAEDNKKIDETSTATPIKEDTMSDP